MTYKLLSRHHEFPVSHFLRIFVNPFSNRSTTSSKSFLRFMTIYSYLLASIRPLYVLSHWSLAVGWALVGYCSTRQITV